MKLDLAPFPVTGGSVPGAPRPMAGDHGTAAEDFATLLERMLGGQDANEGWNPGGWMGAPVKAFQRAGLTEGAHAEAAAASPSPGADTWPAAPAAHAAALHAGAAAEVRMAQDVELAAAIPSRPVAGLTGALPSAWRSSFPTPAPRSAQTLPFAPAPQPNPTSARVSERTEDALRRPTLPVSTEGAGARASRLTARLLTGDDLPVLLLRLPRISGQERAELEAQVARLFESLGLRRPRLVIHETEATHG